MNDDAAGSDLKPPAEDPPPAPGIEEVRLAMALNGGVSLAVWMGGCAVELDAARRAGWGREDLGRSPKGGDGPVRTVYHALCESFKRELVIDIMTGASAGGINGGLLAAAMVSGRRLHPDYVRRQWLTLGDFADLMHAPTTADPRSLMQGVLFATALEDVFETIIGAEDAAAENGLLLPDTQRERSTVSVPQLDMTATDVIGAERVYRDVWDETLSATEYRRRFRFRHDVDFTPGNLAAAARSTASFPGAFEPYRPDPVSWALTADDRGVVGDEVPWLIDGGLLDNAPIRTAIELIPTRAASRQVKRFLVYVNPEPRGVPKRIGVSADGNPQNLFEPELPDVIGYVVNLPRKAPFVDQLDAIEDAHWRSALTADAILPLLAAPLEPMAQAAEALLPAYASRRRLNSLRELLGDPAAVGLALKALKTSDAELPWIPSSIEISEQAEWRWGLSSAIRIVHLLLDLLRFGLEADPDQSETFLAARVQLDLRLSELRTGYQAGRSDSETTRQLRSPDADLAPSQRVAALMGLTGDQPRLALIATRQAMRSFAAMLKPLGSELRLAVSTSGGSGEVELGAALLGNGWQDDDEFLRTIETPGSQLAEIPLAGAERRFLQRVLSIEVVRRAFSAEEQVDSAQQLSFAQLTADAPAPIFTAEPIRSPYPASAESKLAGIRLGHFAGFLKRSWRANDFMWGRLDAAARIVDLLVDPDRARHVGIDSVVDGLRRELLPPNATPEQRWLVEEALEDWAETSGNVDSGAGLLDARLGHALRDDLTNAKGAPLTRTLFTRAAQLEIVQAELPRIAEASAVDAAEGSSTAPLDFGEVDIQEELPADGPLQGAIWNVRRGEPLPHRLGRDDPAESVSDLTARTAARAGFVGLAALRTAKAPGAQAFSLLRPPLLAVTGMASRRVWTTRCLVLAYTGAAVYLATRAAVTSEETADLDLVFSKQVLMAAVAVLAVLGVALLPFFRGVRTRWSAASLAEFGAAAALILGGGGAAIVIALLAGRSPAQLVIADGFDPPPDAVLLLALGGVLGAAVARTPLVRRLWSEPDERTRQGVISIALLALVALAVGIWSLADNLDAITARTWSCVAVVTTALAPIAGWSYLTRRKMIVARLPPRPDTRTRALGTQTLSRP